MTERAKKLLLLYYKQSRKIRRVSGLPPLTFKAKKAGTLKNYRIYGNTETKTRSYSGSAPLSFPIVDGGVSNYRIYGNTVNGESVGDLVTDGQSEHYGKYAIPITNNAETAMVYLDEPLTKSGNNADYIDYAEQKRYNADGTSEDVTLPALPAQSSANSLSVGTAVQPSSVAVDVAEVVSCGDRTENLFDINLSHIPGYINNEGTMQNAGYPITTWDYLKVDSSTTYAIKAFNVKDETSGYINFRVSFYDINKNFLYRLSAVPDGLFETPDRCAYVRFSIDDNLCDIMLIKSTSLPDTYEPYGYKIPITLTADSAETTNIYLDEPLAKSGNNADYIDYATQKRHNSDGTESSITLPAISTLAGTNTLTVGTEVQPSGVEIKGRIKAAGGD